MRAEVGDQLTVSGHKVGEAPRVGRIVEVRGEQGGPPYRVTWDSDGHTSLLFPGPDASVKHMKEKSA